MPLSHILEILPELNIVLSVLEADLSSRSLEEFGVIWCLQKNRNFNGTPCPKSSNCDIPPLESGAVKNKRKGEKTNHPNPTFDWPE